jgi:hypothetical protein
MAAKVPGSKVHPGPYTPSGDESDGEGEDVVPDVEVAARAAQNVSKAAVDAASARRRAKREARKQRRAGLPSNAASWSEEDVSEWLCSIGTAYAVYSASFVGNAVNGDVLLDPDFAENLVELGVLSKMHQKRIIKEIVKLA